MRTSTLEVGDLYSILGAHGIERKLRHIAGVGRVSVPLAAGVPYLFLLRPSIAALAMFGGSALVAINALMLKRTKLTGIRRQTATASVVVLTATMATP